MNMRFRSPGKLILAVGLTLITTLDRYAVPSANLVLVAAPHSGPGRAKRAKQALATSQGRSSAIALGWLRMASRVHQTPGISR